MPKGGPICYNCREHGHIWQLCPWDYSLEQLAAKAEEVGPICFNCQEQGHTWQTCPLGIADGMDPTGMKPGDLQTQAVAANPLRYTKPCRFFAGGYGFCTRGDACDFLHTAGEGQQKPCRYFAAGQCNKGDACGYSHVPCRYFAAGNCLRATCEFLHALPFETPIEEKPAPRVVPSRMNRRVMEGAEAAEEQTWPSEPSFKRPRLEAGDAVDGSSGRGFVAPLAFSSRASNGARASASGPGRPSALRRVDRVASSPASPPGALWPSTARTSLPARPMRTHPHPILTGQVEFGMKVIYDLTHRGWVDSTLDGLDDIWLRDDITGELVLQEGTTAARVFRAAELVFTGEWSHNLPHTEELDLPPEVAAHLTDHLKVLELRTWLGVEVRLMPTEERPGRLLLGPGYAPDIKAAMASLLQHMQGFAAEDPGDVESQGFQPAEPLMAHATSASTPSAPSVPVPWRDVREAHETVEAFDPAAVLQGSGNIDPKTAFQLGWEAAMKAAMKAPEASNKTNGDSKTKGREKTSAALTAAKEETEQEVNAAKPAGLRPKQELDDSELTVMDWVAKQEEFAHLSELPEGWIRVRSKSAGRIYFLNTVTGDTTFEENKVLPQGWKEIVSQRTGKPYYWNASLNLSQHQRPTA